MLMDAVSKLVDKGLVHFKMQILSSLTHP